MSNLDLEKIIFPNDNNIYIIRDAQAHTDLANKANKDGSNIVGPWTMNITGHASQDIAATEKRQPGGVAELDQNGLIITSQLPSSVDEIIEGYYFNNKFYEDAQHTKEITGEASKIYIDLSSNQTYRWSGSTYVEISPSIALGVEHSTAGYGDWTNTAYLHATDANKISAAVASGLYKIAATSEGHIASLTAVTKADITALGIPGTDTNTHRPIQMNGTEILGNNTTALNLKAGTNVSLSNSSGTVTITSTDTNTTYTIGTSGNNVTLTPSSGGGSVQSITVPFATNSTKATQDGNGAVISSTYRKLSNNDFDTINVTELNAGDVVVTGVGRFTNGLYGNLTGNADTATNVGWNGVTGKPSTYPPSPHSHAEIYTVGDYRSSATTPNDYKNMLRFQGLKSKATIDSPSSDTYSYLLGLRGWADNSGGDAWELAFNNSGINVRHGATTTWGSWTKLLDSSNYNDYAPTKTGTGASGTWGISVSGNAATATKATQDGSGNVITSSYTPYKGNLNGTIGSGSPAADMKTYWDNNDNIKTNSVNTAYNNGGQEYAFLLSKGNSNQYGAVIRWGYATKYFEILRKYGTTWKDSDWVKMDAGYADTAGSATKLATARTIELGNDLQGSASFDGSGNITIDAFNYKCTVGGGNQANYPWHRFAYKTNVTGSYTDLDAIFDIRERYNVGRFGRIKVSMRTNNSGGVVQAGARWLYRSLGLAAADVKIATWGTTGQNVYVDIFIKCSTYPRMTIYQVEGNRLFTLVDSEEVSNTTASDPKTSVEVYKTVEDAGTAIHNQAYTQILDAVDVGQVYSAGIATSATNDSDGNAINTTYVKKAGDTMSGGLAITASSSYASYNEGIRINTGAKGFATLLIGGTANSTSGISAGAWWIGANPSNYARKLMIAHNGSGNTTTYFYTNADATITPSLRIGKDLQVDESSVLVGGVKVGNPSNSTFPTVGIAVHDTRNTAQTPGVITGKGANFFFSNSVMPDSNWWAGLHVHGWNDSYAAWEIVGSAHTGDQRNTPLYVRSSNGTSAWGSWRKILDSYNYSSYAVPLSGGTMTGNLAVTSIIGVNATNGTTGGISLYGGTENVDNYGIAFRLTSNKGVHGYVQGNWATYFTMDAQSNRGWVFKNSGGTGNVASISNNGNAVFNGSVTVGGNAANTSGMRLVYNSTTKSLDFVFVA